MTERKFWRRARNPASEEPDSAQQDPAELGADMAPPPAALAEAMQKGKGSRAPNAGRRGPFVSAPMDRPPEPC